MNLGETFKQLYKQPIIESDSMDFKQMGAEMRQVNIETVHKLSDVLTPIAKSMEKLMQEASTSISKISTIRSVTEATADKMQLRMRETTDHVTTEITHLTRLLVQQLQAFKEQKEIDTMIKWLKVIAVTSVTSLITMFLYMRFLN